MIFKIFILLLSIPIGFAIAWFARDELAKGRKYFIVLIIAGIIGVIGSWIYGFQVVSWTCAFILGVSFISYIKSFDKGWIKF